MGSSYTLVIARCGPAYEKKLTWYLLSNFWTASAIETQKAAEDSQNKENINASWFYCAKQGLLSFPALVSWWEILPWPSLFGQNGRRVASSFFFRIFLDLDIKMQRQIRPVSSHFDQTRLVNKAYSLLNMGCLQLTFLNHFLAFLGYSVKELVHSESKFRIPFKNFQDSLLIPIWKQQFGNIQTFFFYIFRWKITHDHASKILMACISLLAIANDLFGFWFCSNLKVSLLSYFCI